MPHVHNALHHAVSLQDGYRKAVGETDPGFTGIERAGETLTPTLNLWELPEWALARGERLLSGYVEKGATAGELAFVGVRNPANSGLLVTVLEFFIAGTASLDYHVFNGVIIATGVDGSQQCQPRDARELLAGAGRTLLIHGADVAAIGNDASEERRAETTGKLTFDWSGLKGRVLPPNRELRVYVGTVNTGFNAGFIVRERPALSGELALP